MLLLLYSWGNETNEFPAIDENYYVISSVMYAFWLVLTYDLSEDRRIDDVIIKTFFSVYFNSLLYKTNRFQVAVRLFSNRSQMTSKFSKNKKVAHSAAPRVPLMFLPHFDVLCDLLLNRCTATWNLFVKYTTFQIGAEKELVCSMKPLTWRIGTVTA